MKRLTSLLLVGTLAASLNAALPAVAGEVRPSKDTVSLPKRKLVRQMPQFLSQPRVERSGGQALIVAQVQLTPWRTAGRNTNRLWDTVSYRLQVSKKGQAIRSVSLAPKAQRGLLARKKVKPTVIKQGGRYTVAFPISSKVARSLTSESARQQRQRIRISVEHRKDVRPRINGRDVTQVVQSGTIRDTKRSGAQLANTSSAPPVTFWLYNYTPFDAQVSIQGTQCISDISYGGSINSNSTWMVNGFIENSGQQGAYSQSDSQSLSQGAITSLQSSASEAASNAVSSGASLYTPTGAVSAAVGWAGDFLVDFLQDLSANSCKNLPTLYTTSFVAESVGNESTTQPYSYNNADSVLAPVAPSLPPTGSMINSTVGAQTSTQWHWNNNNPEPASNGAFNWAGGLISMAPENNSWQSNDGVNYNTNVAWYFVSDGANQTGMGPEPNVWPAVAGDPDSPSLSANWNSNGDMVLTCNPGQWSVSNPWGDSLALSPPPNTNTYSANQAYLTWGYNGTVNGQPVYGQPFPDVSPVTKFATTAQQQQINSEVLSSLPAGTKISEWVCTVSASVQVQSWAVPSGWPSALGGTPNGAWWSAPNVVVTAPYVAP